MPRPTHADGSREEKVSAATLLEAKRAMRTRILAARDALDPAWRALASQAIVERIASLPAFTEARALLVTLPFRSEWDTRRLVAQALSARKLVVVPRVDREARMLELREVRDLEADIVEGHLGVPEPRVTCAVVPHDAIGVAIVPGVAFDLAGRRLGYGGGFYDRLLPLLDSRVPRIAGAFEPQLVEQVPAGSHDVAVDCIATEARLIARVG